MNERCRKHVVREAMSWRLTHRTEFSLGRQISRPRNSPSVQNPKIHYHNHNSPSHNPLHALINPLSCTHFNIILPSKPGTLQVFSSPHIYRLQFCMHFSHLPCMLHALTEHPNLLNLMVPAMPSDIYNLRDSSNEEGIK